MYHNTEATRYAPKFQVPTFSIIYILQTPKFMVL